MTASTTEVVLVFYEGRIEHWLRFGTQDRERILDRRRRVIAFRPRRDLRLCALGIE